MLHPTFTVDDVASHHSLFRREMLFPSMNLGVFDDLVAQEEREELDAMDHALKELAYATCGVSSAGTRIRDERTALRDTRQKWEDTH